MEAGRRFGAQLAIAVLERLYALVPGLGATACVFLMAPMVHGGSAWGRPLIVGLLANLSAALYILIVGAPGLLRTWRRWIVGLGVVLLGSVAFSVALL